MIYTYKYMKLLLLLSSSLILSLYADTVTSCASGPPLGIGTVRFRAFLEEAVTNFRNIQRVSSLMLDTPGSAAPDANRTEAQIRLEVSSIKTLTRNPKP